MTDEQEVQQAHEQNLQDEQKRLAAKAAEEKRKERERKDKAAANKRAWRAAKKAALDRAVGKAKASTKKGKPTAKAKPAKTAKPKKGKFDHAAKITVLAEKNPKRPGTDSHRRFALYRSGMTVADYFAKGGSAPDLLWDLHHKFIKL